jgi:hypothetical protein
MDVECTGAFASRLAPTGIFVLKMIAQKKWQPRLTVATFPNGWITRRKRQT